ncbi:MAG: hypothetical protein JKX71_13970 [Amylibacter sp.]|nr:hypothetical protein [Amylibacter sp.]
MKLLLITILLSLQISGSQAATQFGDEDCKSIADLAHVIMVGRQGGIAMTKMIDGFTREPNARVIIIDAYKLPRVHSHSLRKTVTEDFRDKWALACYTQDASD